MTHLSQQPLIHETAAVNNCRLGAYVEIADRCRLDECKIGDYSYLMQDCSAWCTTIGKFASIASNVRFNATNHPMDRASQHHFTYRSSDYWSDADHDADFFAWRREHSVSVGNDTWFGHGAIVLPGTEIGDGAVVGAGSVVTRDVGPYQVVAGNPARIIKSRFAPEIAERLRAMAWWNWTHDQVRAALNDFRMLHVEQFLEKYERTPPSAP